MLGVAHMAIYAKDLAKTLVKNLQGAQEQGAAQVKSLSQGLMDWSQHNRQRITELVQTMVEADVALLTGKLKPLS